MKYKNSCFRPKDAIKAFKKQLSNSTADTKVFLTTLTVIILCLLIFKYFNLKINSFLNFQHCFHAFFSTQQVLETCVKNCGFRFHTQLAQKDVLQEFTSILLQKATPPVDCVDRVLGLLQVFESSLKNI